MIDEWGKGAKYWDQAWNPMIGCRKASEGCANCYAARLAAQYPELQSADGGFEPHPPKHLKMPPKSGVVFAGNMTDLFGDWIEYDRQIYDLLARLAPSATNLILTKRANRMQPVWYSYGDKLPESIWWGITAENHHWLNWRWESFCEVRGNTWLSLEPLLGEVYLDDDCGMGTPVINEVDWVVVGAESGPDRRPCKIEWVRQIVKQCREAGVPVFVKQLDIDGKLVKDISKFPEDLQIRQIPWKRGEA